MTELKCSYCKNPFQDGDCVSIIEKTKKAYHRIVRPGQSRPTDCLDKDCIFNMQQIGRENYAVFYKGNFYSIQDMDNLKNVNKLMIRYRENKGDLIEGNLEGLSRCKPILGFFQKPNTKI